MKASATYRVALRRLAHAGRRPVPQLFCLLLTLVLVAIPLNGMPAPPTPSLIPLRTTFVPFDASIESPTLTAVQISVAAPSARRIALASNTISFPIPQHHSVARDVAIDGQCRSGITGLPSIRSPPRA